MLHGYSLDEVSSDNETEFQWHRKNSLEIAGFWNILYLKYWDKYFTKALFILSLSLIVPFIVSKRHSSLFTWLWMTSRSQVKQCQTLLDVFLFWTDLLACSCSIVIASVISTVCYCHVWVWIQGCLPCHLFAAVWAYRRGQSKRPMATLQRIGSNTCPRKTSRPVQTRMYSNSTLARIIVEPAYKEQTSAMLEKHMARALNALGCFVAKNPLGGMHR